VARNSVETSRFRSPRKIRQGPEPETNHYAITIPSLGSLIASMSFTSKEVGLTDFAASDRLPMLIPFFAFRMTVGCGERGAMR
jgi:cytochrome bd-type quinol oxidase subunit 1